MAIEDQNVFESRAHHAVNQVGQHGQKRSGPQRQRPRMAHVMFADAGHQSFRHQRMRTQSFRHGDGDVTHAAPIVFHGEVFEVLLDGGHGNDARLQFAGLHSLAKLASRVLALQNFRVAHGLLHISIPFGSGMSSVMILQLAPISRIFR